MTTTVFIGLGAMGAPMAAHLARQAAETGGKTLVWNRHHEKAQAHAQQYGTTPAELREVAQADIIFTCLPTSAEVDEVIQAALPWFRGGQTWVDCTSGHPDSARRQRAALLERGVKYLDAPVSGGVNGAQTGQLTIMLGGPADEVEAVRSHLPFAGKIVHVGDTGAGFAVKAVNNMLLAVNLWATGEGLAVLGRADVNMSAALDVINASSGRSNASQNLIPARVLTREFPATFALGLLAKDARIGLDIISQVKGSAPVLAQTAALMDAAARMIGPHEDHTAALKLIEQMNDKEIK